MTSRRMRRLAALTIIGMALSACADGDGLAKAGAPEAGRAGESPASSQSGATAPDEAPDDLGLGDVAALGVATPSTPAGTPGAPSGHEGATGAPVAGGLAVPGGSPAGGGGAAAPTPSGAADTGPASGGGSSGAPSGGSGSPQPKIAATPEDCAMLRQVMAIVDHPQLHQLKADTGC